MLRIEHHLTTQVWTDLKRGRTYGVFSLPLCCILRNQTQEVKRPEDDIVPFLALWGLLGFFHSRQPVGIDVFKLVRFSFPVISEFLTPFTTIVPYVSKSYHIGVVLEQIDAPEIAITDINLVG